MIARLENKKYKIHFARSTAEGLEKFDKKLKPYRFIISDLGRTEKNEYIDIAGIDLLKAIRERQPNVLFVIFSWSDKMPGYRGIIEQFGGIPITSTMELQAFFDKFAPQKEGNKRKFTHGKKCDNIWTIKNQFAQGLWASSIAHADAWEDNLLEK